MNQKLFNMIFTMKDIAVYRLQFQVPVRLQCQTTVSVTSTARLRLTKRNALCITTVEMNQYQSNTIYNLCSYKFNIVVN